MIQWFVDGRKNYKGPVVELVGDGDEVVYAADDLDDRAGGGDAHGEIARNVLMNGNGEMGEMTDAARGAKLQG